MRDLRALQRQPRDVQQRIARALEAMVDNPWAADVRRLESQEPVWRRRVGDWRILFEVDGERREVTIQRILHRRDIYRVLS